AGDRHDVPALLERIAGGDERPALLVGFDDDNPEGDPTDQTVAKRKMVRQGWDPRPVLTDQSAMLTDTCGQGAVLRRIDAIDPGSEHGNRRAARREASAMGRP